MKLLTRTTVAKGPSADLPLEKVPIWMKAYVPVRGDMITPTIEKNLHARTLDGMQNLLERNGSFEVSGEINVSRSGQVGLLAVEGAGP